MQLRSLHLGLGSLLCALVVSAACKDDEHVVPPPGTVSGGDERVDTETMVPGDGQSDFISDVSQQNGGRGLASGAGGGAGSSSIGTNEAAPAAAGGDSSAAQRAISEADILQLDGDRLYALSRYSGLSIVDVSNPAALKLEGVYRSAAEPFEMYVQDGMVFAMFNGWYT